MRLFKILIVGSILATGTAFYPHVEDTIYRLPFRGKYVVEKNLDLGFICDIVFPPVDAMGIPTIERTKRAIVSFTQVLL